MSRHRTSPGPASLPDCDGVLPVTCGPGPHLATWPHGQEDSDGDVAQLGERRLCKPEVAGSSPVVSTRKTLHKSTLLRLGRPIPWPRKRPGPRGIVTRADLGVFAALLHHPDGIRRAADPEKSVRVTMQQDAADDSNIAMGILQIPVTWGSRTVSGMGDGGSDWSLAGNGAGADHHPGKASSGGRDRRQACHGGHIRRPRIRTPHRAGYR